MKTIYKYPLPIEDVVSIDMPVGAEVLTVQMQRGEPQLWALVPIDTWAPKERRLFRVAGTGHPIGSKVRRYIGTFQLLNGDLVFHVFEVEK